MLKGITDKDLRVVVSKAERAGCEVSWSRGKALHVHIKCPNGELVVAPGTPRSARAAKKVRAELRHNGVDVG